MTKDALRELNITVQNNLVRQNPQYSIAALEKGVYVIGMKDQFNIYDMQSNPLAARFHYIADEMGFILYDKNKGVKHQSIDDFGPYFIEQYILMEILSKQEVAQNVLDYYVNHRDKLQSGLSNYTETQGKGFVCWRFLIHQEESAKAAFAVSNGNDAQRAGAAELGADDKMDVVDEDEGV